MQWRLIKSIGKSIGVKVSPIPLQKYRYWYQQYFQRKVLVSLLAILFADIVNKPAGVSRCANLCPILTNLDS